MPSLPSLLLQLSGSLIQRNVEDLPEEVQDEENYFDARQSLGDFEATYEDDIEYEGASSASQGGSDIANDKRNFMYTYLNAIQRQLQNEFHPRGKKGTTKPWLENELKRRQWRLPACLMKKYCTQLGILNSYEQQNFEHSYARDVYVWRPEKRWGDAFYPPCINCQNNKEVEYGGVPEWPGRRICTLESCFYVITARYRCRKCKEAAKTATGSQKPQQTWMGRQIWLVFWHEIF